LEIAHAGDRYHNSISTNSAWFRIPLSMVVEYLYRPMTYANKMNVPPARNSPATCENFTPRWGSYKENSHRQL